MDSRARLLKLAAAIGLVALAASACGRRGSLEAPPSGASSAATPESRGPAGARSLPQSVGLGGGSSAPDPDAVRDGDEIASSAVPVGGSDAPIKTSRGAKRGYVIPKQPFFLDPLL